MTRSCIVAGSASLPSADEAAFMSLINRLTSFGRAVRESVTGGSHETPDHGRSLQKQPSRGNRPSTAAHDLLEAHCRDAISAFVDKKFQSGEAKPHCFTQVRQTNACCKLKRSGLLYVTLRRGGADE